MIKTNSVNDKQKQFLVTLTEIMNYHQSSIDGDLVPEIVFQAFVSKYIFIEDGNPKGYKDGDGKATKEFEKTLFFQHICAYLRNKSDKSYVIDNQITLMFQVLSISYKFNHFDPRIYNYVN
jgi:hypothetical protein